PAVDVRGARDAAHVAVAQIDRVEPEAGGHQVGRGVGNELRRRRVDALAVPELAEGATPPAEAPAGIVDAAGHVYSGGERKEPAPAVDRRGLGRARLTRQLDPRIGELAVAVAPPAVARAIPGDRASMGSTGADPGEGDATRDRARF